MSGPAPKMLTRAGATLRVSLSNSSSRLRISLLSWRQRQARERRVYLAAAVGSSRGPGRKLLQREARASAVRPFRLSRSLAGQ